MSYIVNRIKNRLYPDPKRVIARFYIPGSLERADSLIRKVLDMEEDEVNQILIQLLRNFSARHRNISKVFEKHFNKIITELKNNSKDFHGVSKNKKLLIGSYFTNEYSIESAAFFNPSVVEHPDQTDLEPGQKRFIVSFRATGEGHISSLVFRSGTIDKENNIEFHSVGKMLDEAEVIKRHVYDKKTFLKKLEEMNIHKDIVSMVFDRLGNKFIYGELQASIEEVLKNIQLTYSKKQVIKEINWLADSHYEITFSLDTAISERVIFPISYSERNGIEDARFVRFTEDDGKATYYATYTAYDGFTILPKLLKTKDFYHFEVIPINGIYAQNKNLALFPRKINGKYVMLSRVDGINNYIMYSDKINLWQNATKIQEPEYHWEFIQIGNCGSPLETEYGWLLMTHGVGPMRRYCISVTLLDLEDPSNIIARLKEPLIIPNEEEREGYVPNVVYSCGALIHNNVLFIPYAMSDYATTFATVSLDMLFDKLNESSLQGKNVIHKNNRKSILLVDDDIAIRKVIPELLKRHGYHVKIASNGVEALLLMDREKFDLILSDILMPKLDGYQLLEHMNKKNINIPVVFLTGIETDESEIRSLKLGAVDYIKKPVINDILLLRLKKLLDSYDNEKLY
ncbi:response regulator [candidate division KSB1 bacterium]|nr:response regulator [candidate division KSB1 bacterium]